MYITYKRSICMKNKSELFESVWYTEIKIGKYSTRNEKMLSSSLFMEAKYQLVLRNSS